MTTVGAKPTRACATTPNVAPGVVMMVCASLLDQTSNHAEIQKQPQHKPVAQHQQMRNENDRARQALPKKPQLLELRVDLRKE